MNVKPSNLLVRLLCCGVGLVALAAGVGCQADLGGQTLPSPYYLTDDLHYAAPGHEFPLSREAAAMQQFKNSQAR
jgi:hypothetical protein